MPRGKRVKRQSEENEGFSISEVKVKLTYEERLTRLREEKNYYAFKYVKDKEGKYDGVYLCCNCKTTMRRLVKNWNKELDTYAYGPWEVKKGMNSKIIVPDFETIKNKTQP